MFLLDWSTLNHLFFLSNNMTCAVLDVGFIAVIRTSELCGDFSYFTDAVNCSLSVGFFVPSVFKTNVDSECHSDQINETTMSSTEKPATLFKRQIIYVCIY